MNMQDARLLCSQLDDYDVCEHHPSHVQAICYDGLKFKSKTWLRVNKVNADRRS